MESKLVVIPGMNPRIPTRRKTAPTAIAVLHTSGSRRSVVPVDRAMGSAFLLWFVGAAPYPQNRRYARDLACRRQEISRPPHSEGKRGTGPLRPREGGTVKRIIMGGVAL